MGQAEQEKEQESQSLEELFRELEELIENMLLLNGQGELEPFEERKG